MSKVQGYVDDALTAFERLCVAIEEANPAHWQIREPDGWSLKLLASHVVQHTRFHAQLIRHAVNEPLDEPDTWTGPRDAALETGPAATAEFMRADHAIHVPYLRTLTDDQLGYKVETKIGVLSVEYLVRRLSSHVRQHTRQAMRIREAAEQAPNEQPETFEEETMEKDPVCGMDVDPKTAAASYEYQGKTYYFCAPGCKKAFQANPEQYLTK
ncbi:MAG: YHS domain-containing protein [Dehalococcoidia bacterium]